MKRTATILAILTGALTGCHEDVQEKADVTGAAGSGQDLRFAYPTRNQQSVPTSAPFFLRFGDTIETPTEQITDALRLEGPGDNTVDFDEESLRLTSEGKGFRIRPESELKPGRRYSLTVSGLEVGGTLVNLEKAIAFTTAASRKGPLSHRTDMSTPLSVPESNGFEVARILPYADSAATSIDEGSDTFPVSDLSTFRLQFTEPVDESSVHYGNGDSGTIRITDGNGELVEAEVLVRGHRMTIDPENDLDPAKTYTLRAGSGIRSAIDGTGLSVPDSPWRFRPLDSASPSGERERMAQKASTDAGKLALTDEDYNSVLLSSLLLGPDNKTIQSGTVFAELGFIPRFDRAGRSVPLRIDRGALMEGTSVAVEVAGQVPAGYESGTIDVRFLSDANGYLMPNPYTDDNSAPRLVRLFVDLALNTDDPRANGALTQELLHVELVGTALVEDGLLTLEAVSVIEPEVLGVDQASGLISFRLENFENSDAAPSEDNFTDTEGPGIKAWTPGDDHQGKLQPEDPLHVFFDEPVLPSSIDNDSVRLRKADGTVIEANLKLNGSTVTMTPEAPLEHGTNYQILLDGSRITDLAGNELSGARQLDFSLPATEPASPQSQAPLVLTTLPGYPCAKTQNVDLTEREQGRCLGGITLTPDTRESEKFGMREADDMLPIEAHDTEQPLIVRFSQAMDPDSIRRNETVIVEERADGEWQAFTNYQLRVSDRALQVIPDQAWEAGRLYRYSLVSDGSDIQGIQSKQGLPLQTRILSQDVTELTRTSGGPELVNHFVARPSAPRTLTPLSNLPTRDINSNLELDPKEAGVAPDGDGNYSAAANAGKVLIKNFPDTEEIDGDPQSGPNAAVDTVNIGCPAKEGETDDDWEDCPRNKFIYQTALLDVEVLEPETTNTNEVPVKLHPSVLFATGLDVHIYSEALDALEAADSPHQIIPTGPMVMRMRYEGENRDELISGTISQDANGQLIFETELDVYLDAPFMDPEIPESDGMDHNMRSFRLDNLSLKGPITFLDDGRMQIEQRNTEPVPLEEVTVAGTVVNGLVDATTIMDLEIPEGELYLNYISPYTQTSD